MAARERAGSDKTKDRIRHRELDEALNLTSPAPELLNDWRTGDSTQHSMVALLRQPLYSRLAGYMRAFCIRPRAK